MPFKKYRYTTDLENTFYDLIKNWEKKDLIDFLVRELPEDRMIEIIDL